MLKLHYLKQYSQQQVMMHARNTRNQEVRQEGLEFRFILGYIVRYTKE